MPSSISLRAYNRRPLFPFSRKHQLSRILRLLLLLLSLPVTVLAANASPLIGGEAGGTSARHFCRLLLNDGTTISPLSYHAQRLLVPNDSMTVEQQFMSYVFYNDNWQSLRLFPHRQADGTINWYAPADKLPASIGLEHQKYIREVFPRMQQEIEAGNWNTVDAYIDRMIEYQCTFGSATPTTNHDSKEAVFGFPVSQGLGTGIALLSIILLPLLCHSKKRKANG